MLQREFTFKEKVLLAIFILLAISILYYQFVFKGVRNGIRQFSTENLEEQIVTETARMSKIKQMEDVIANTEKKDHGELFPYNNLANEIAIVGDILNTRADNINLTWNDATLTGTTVRRVVNVAFRTDSYDHFKDILKAFNECKYRCQIGDINISPNRTTRTGTDDNVGLENANDISANFTATFFETVDGATSTEGLVVITSDDSDGTGALEDRAHAYE